MKTVRSCTLNETGRQFHDIYNNDILVSLILTSRNIPLLCASPGVVSETRRFVQRLQLMLS